MPRQRHANKARTAGLAAVADRFKAFRPAREVLTKVRAVPTRFIQFDHATRVGGLPIERFNLLHGPSNEGKTLFTLGLCDSFLSGDHFVLYIDAERTTPITWVQQLMGANANHPAFFAYRPESYEAAQARVQEFINTLASERDKGNVPPTTSALIVCDSLRKLVPRDLMKEVMKETRKESEMKSGRDRAGQLRAKMNAAWMDELVPLLEHGRASFVAISREMVDPDADQWAKKFGRDYKVGGGGAVYYESSLVIRVERDAWVQKKGTNEKGETRVEAVYGERHMVTIRKTKVAGKDDKQVICFFHSSNGVLVPAGFDRARDVFEMAVRFGVVHKSGNSYVYDGSRFAQGEHNAVVAMTTDPGLLARIEGDSRAKFVEIAPTEFDQATGEVT